MPLQEKITHIQTFTGGINTTYAREAVPSDSPVWALNCHVMSTAQGNVGVVTNPKGNLKITTPLPSGVNETIGYGMDEEENQFAFFVWNSLGHHRILLFNSITRIVTKIIESILDTGGIDILNFSNLRQYRINMCDINKGNIYWVDGGLNKARKINIAMALDKTSTGYGSNILPEYINAYKQSPIQAPVVTYFSDTSVLFNTMYGSLRKFVYRFIYKGGEKSDYSDYSNVATPGKESFTGVNTVPTDNNGLHILLETGNIEVKAIELAMQTTLDTGLSSWLLVATLDKTILGIPNNSTYTYNFYNNGKYGSVDNVEKVIRPYTFLPDRPKCQALVRGAMIYGNFRQGWDNFALNVTNLVRYDPFAINTGVINKTNNPQLILYPIPGSNITLSNGDTIIKEDGTSQTNRSTAFTRNSAFRVTIGADVKLGNTFSINLGNGNLQDNHNVSYTATATDTPTTVATQLRNQLIAQPSGSGATFVVYRKGGSGPEYNIYTNIANSDGSVAFEFNIGAVTNAGYIQDQGTTVNPVSYETLNDTGQSIKNMKHGDTRQWAIVYRDDDGRKSSSYTNSSMVIPIKTLNELGGFTTPTIRFSIYHQPPLWATKWQLAVSDSFVYDDFIQMLIQKVIDVPSTGAEEYLDLLVGSLYTFQKIHKSTSLTYEFVKGDRLRLLRRTSDETYYPFFETEILSYQDTVDELINENLTTNGTDQVAVKLTDATNIGRILSFDENEREILSVTDSTHYTVNAPVGSTEPLTYTSYHLIDRRGTLRIRKPIINIEDYSMVEIYHPAAKSEDGTGIQNFYLLNPTYDVLNKGTAARAHAAPYFNQEIAINQPGIIEVTQGNIYVRNREQPTTNNYPGAQTKIEVVEDPSFSDFYQSDVNDLGRVSVQDTGEGRVKFGDRLRFSNNYIEDTKINGLNDFDNLDRKDYNDKFGDIVLLKYVDSRLLVYKELKCCWVPVYAKIIQDKDGQEFVGTSSELLGDINNFAWEGGIGDNPESYASNGTMKYHVSVNSGIMARIGGDGITPISEIYNLDNEVRSLLRIAGNNGAKIIGGFDRKNGEYLIYVGATTANAAATLAFDEKENKFITYYTFYPEAMIRFKDEFFAFKNGELWEQDVNEVRNNFFGVQYNSGLSFYVNTNPKDEKNYSTIHLDSNKPWAITEVKIYPTEGKSQGMLSRIKKGNFQKKQSTWYADFLRNMIDPRFTNQDIALFNGAALQGQVMKITMINDDTTEVRLKSVDVRISEQNYNIKS